GDASFTDGDPEQRGQLGGRLNQVTSDFGPSETKCLSCYSHHLVGSDGAGRPARPLLPVPGHMVSQSRSHGHFLHLLTLVDAQTAHKRLAVPLVASGRELSTLLRRFAHQGSAGAPANVP